MHVYTSDTTQPARLKVGIADYAVGREGNTLTTSGLGSCVAVALYDPGTSVSGLVHAMLPESDGDGDPAKFADTGVETLVTAMTDEGADRDRLVAKLAGGSTMFDFAGADDEGSIGDRNVASARRTLASLGVDVVADDVGGGHGRSVTLDCETGELHVRSAKTGESTL